MDSQKIKKSFFILLIAVALIILSVSLVMIMQTNKKDNNKNSLNENKILNYGLDINAVINKKKNGLALTREEDAVLNSEIEKKIISKTEQIKAVAKDRSYSSSEIDFLLNPKTNTEKDLGL